MAENRTTNENQANWRRSNPWKTDQAFPHFVEEDPDETLALAREVAQLTQSLKEPVVKEVASSWAGGGTPVDLEVWQANAYAELTGRSVPYPFVENFSEVALKGKPVVMTKGQEIQLSAKKGVQQNA